MNQRKLKIIFTVAVIVVFLLNIPGVTRECFALVSPTALSGIQNLALLILKHTFFALGIIMLFLGVTRFFLRNSHALDSESPKTLFVWGLILIFSGFGLLVLDGLCISHF